MFSEPLATLGVLLDKSGLGSNNLTDGLGGSLLGVSGLGTDSGVALGVKLGHVLDLGGGQTLFPVRELSLESVSITLLETIVVVLDVLAHNVVLVDGGVVLGFLAGVSFLDLLSTLVGDNFLLDLLEAGESLLGVGNVEATVAGTLHGTEDTVTGGGADETDVEVSLEGASVLLNVVPNGEHLSVNLDLTFVELGHVLKGEETTGNEETGSIGSGVVGKTSSDTTEVLELLRISLADGTVTLDGGVDDGGNDSAVSSSNAESVLLLVVLVLVLEDKTTSGEVVGLTLTTTDEFGLVSAAVGVALKDFDEGHLNEFINNKHCIRF